MGEKRTYADRRDYLIRAVSNRRRKLKAMAIEYKGGKCRICGYSKHQVALDFHHIDPSEKDFAMGQRGYTRSWEKIKAELDKCILLCATCHREVKAGVTQLPEGIQERKRGELLEAQNSPTVGNQQPSPAPVLDGRNFFPKLELGGFRDYPKGVVCSKQTKHLASHPSQDEG